MASTDSTKSSVCASGLIFGREHHRHEDQQPEQLVVTDFFEQRFHESVLFGCGFGIVQFADHSEEKPVDSPHIRMPVNPSIGPSSRHSFGSSRSPYPNVA